MKKINFLLVLFSLYILSSCQNPVSPPQPQSPLIPAGKGAFTLVISDVNGRTILPSLNFAEYKFVFTPEGSGTPITETRANYNQPFILDIGKYNLQVTAYMSAGGSKPAAYGELPDIEIKENQVNTGSVSMKAFTTGTGTFRWNITFSGLTLKEASMTITPLGSDGTPAQTLYFSGAPAGTPVTSNNSSLELKSGYYNVLITLIKDDDTQIIKRWEILHIYQNMESYFPFTFYNSDFSRKNYIVTFVYNNDVLSDGLQTYDLGAKITEPDPTRAGHIFDGWYKDKALAVNWDIDKETVPGNMTLYAKWLPAVTLVFSFAITDHAPIVDSGITIFTGMGGNDTATITVTNADDFTNIEWYYNGNRLGTGGTITLNSSQLGNINGYRFITVEAIKEDDGALYSAIVMVKVQMPAARIGTTLYATLYDAIKAVGDTVSNSAEIVLLSNVTAPETGMTAATGYTIANGQTISITVETDCNMSIKSSAGGFALFTVNAGASLTLDGSKGSLTLSGGGLDASANRRGIYINNGTVVINDNVTIAGFKNSTASSSYYGGGVYVTGANASFTMNGGIIYGDSTDIPPEQRNTAYYYAAIYVGTSGTAKYGGERYGNANITNTSDTLPILQGTITISPSNGINTRLFAVYNGSETVSYQWAYSSSSSGTQNPISGATSATHIPVNIGYYTVTVSAPGYTSKTSAIVSVDTGTLMGNIIITPNGRIDPGTVLTASYDGPEPETNNVTINYQWRHETTSISGENTSVYTPTDPGIYNQTLSATGYSSKSSAAPDIVAYILPGTVTSLTDGQWIDGRFTSSTQQDWYYIDVTSGTTYRVWINNSTYNYGDGTKTANTYLNIIYEDGELICLDQYYYYSWSGVSFTPASGFNGKVYVQVKPYSSISGTYGIAYSAGTTRPINNTLNPSSRPAQSLTENEWKDGTLDSATSQDWYYFDVENGKTYYVWWNERQSYLSNTYKNGVKLADVDVTAWYNNDSTEAFVDKYLDTSWWPTPKSFTADRTGTITLQIRPNSASSSYTGDYQIVYSTNSAKPSGNSGDWTVPASSTTLTDGTWTTASLSSTSQQDWYSFDVTEGATYYIWWYDRSYTSSSTNAYITVSGCYGNGEVFFLEQTGKYNTAQSFKAAYSGKVYLQVKSYLSSYTGSYRIVFREDSTRPAL